MTSEIILRTIIIITHIRVNEKGIAMSACTFFGHSECYGLDEALLSRTVEALICQGVDTFYVGNQGRFDSGVYFCLKRLQKRYPNIRVAVVLAYLSGEKRAGEEMQDTMYPEIEGSPKFAIERRNRWMIRESDCYIYYVNHTWGGAYKFARLAKRQGLTVINLGHGELEQ